MTTPRLLSERYELGEVLGYGGMSEVHRGLDTRLGRDVAVKVLRADLARDPQFQMRFRREAQNAAALNHPAIVAVYDTGEVQSESGPLPYIVMEYVDGQTLREIVKTSGPMTQQKVIEVMADVCAALDFSHRHQIIHRDVKPANIMINRAGAVKVMDFGIARALGEGQNVTQTAAVIGTAQYLSPEQARGEAVDARSDVYAAGCVLYELLTGEPPFTGDTPVAVAYQHVREEPKRPSSVNPNIPPELDSVVLKALSKNPANRYQSAAEMRNDLVRVRNGQPPLAPAVMSDAERTAMLGAGQATGATRRLNGGGRHAPPPVQQGYDDYYDDEPPRRNTGRLVAIIAAVVVALGAIGFVAYQLLSGPPPAAKIAVPAVLGMSFNDASNQIVSKGLKVNPNPTRVDSSPQDKDKVTGTNPTGGEQVLAGTLVTITVGNGPPNANVPDVSGQSVDDATAKLTAAGFTVGNTKNDETSDTTKQGKVTRTDPGAGKNAPTNKPVDIYVGIAPAKITIPDLKGKSAKDAKQQLVGLGIPAAQITGQAVDGNDVNDNSIVVQTNPPANTQVDKTASVELLVSEDGTGGNTGGNTGGTIRMPSVVGKNYQDAYDQLKQLGFTNVSGQGVTVTNRNDDKKVKGQDPQSGSKVPANTPIVLQVGQYAGGTLGN